MSLRFLSTLLCLMGFAFASGCSSDTGGDGSESSTGDDSAGDSEGDDEWDDDDWGDDEDDWNPEAGEERRAGAAETLGITPPETPWAEMSHGEREMYMVGKIMPIMHEQFVEHDAARFGEFDCASCHGRDASARNFEMPPPDLFPVPNPGTPAWDSMARTFPEAVAFMSETVTPTMGTLMGEENYTCHHCHPGGS